MNGTDRAIRWLAAAAPVVLVNVVAFSGQLAFLRDHLPWVPAGQVLMAVTLEVIAVYLAWQAHLAQLANDSALRLRLAAYGFALLIAAMNYSHYAGPGWRPTFVAVAVALCSAASPWLWGIHTRRTSRDRLMAAGLVEAHALRLGATRWAWHPYRSARVMSAATWHGTTDPGEAIEAVYPPAKNVAGETPNGKGPVGSPATQPEQLLPPEFTDKVSAAEVAYRCSVRGGNPFTAWALHTRFDIPRPVAAEIVDRVSAEVTQERSRGGAVHGTKGTVPAVMNVPAGGPPEAAAQPPPAGTSSNGQVHHV